jgi:DNA replication protein
MECEKIKEWIDEKYSHELIKEALKEAIYNGAPTLRYVETVLCNWRKKGYKTKAEVREAKNKYYESKKESKEEKDYFYYDWLNDD